MKVAGGEDDEPLLPPGEEFLLLDPHDSLPDGGVTAQQTGAVLRAVRQRGRPGGCAGDWTLTQERPTAGEVQLGDRPGSQATMGGHPPGLPPRLAPQAARPARYLLLVADRLLGDC